MINIAERVTEEKERLNHAILDVIRRRGPVAKTEITKLTGINIVTVSNYVNDYIKEGLVFEKGLDVSTGGRRPVLIELNPELGYVIGAGLTLHDVSAVVLDLKGGVIFQTKKDRPRGSGKALIDALLEIVNEAITGSNVGKDKILGIGIAIPGVIDRRANTIRCWGTWGTEEGTEIVIPVSIEELIKDKFDLPSVVENDADAAVFGERWFTQRSDVQNMLYMYSGVGCGIIINGQIYEGSSGNAGELGITNPEATDPETWRRDSLQLGTWEMDLGIVTRSRIALSKGEKSSIFTKVNQDAGLITPKAIFDSAKEGDSLAVKLLEEAGTVLGRKIAFLVNLLNPEVVVIGGGIEQAGAPLLDSVKKSVLSWGLPEAISELKITPAQLGEDAVILGAASLVINRVFACA